MFFINNRHRWAHINSKNCLFIGVILVKNADSNKYFYSGYGTGFDSRSEFSLPDGSARKNVIVFGVDMTSSVHIVNKGKDILILGFGPTQGLAEGQYSINFLKSNGKFCLSFYCNGNNSFLIVNATKIYQFKVKRFEINKTSHVFRKYFGKYITPVFSN